MVCPLQVDDHVLHCRVNNSCRLYGQQLTVHLADAPRRGPALAPSDLAALRAWVNTPAALPIDYVNVSFCRSAQDVMTTRAALDQ